MRLAKDGAVLPESSYTRSATLAGKPLTGLVDARKVLALFDDGATIVLPGTAPVLAAADPAGRGARARARPPVPGQRLPHAAGLPGLRGPLRHATTSSSSRPPAPSSGRCTRPTASRTLLLEPGLSMYLPTGTPHAARAQETVSLHVTLGINQLTWRGLVRRSVAALRRRGARRAPARRLPRRPGRARRRASPIGSPRSPTRSAASTRSAAVDAEVRRFLTGRGPRLRRRPPRRAPGSRDLDDTTPLRRRPGPPVRAAAARRPARGAARRPRRSTCPPGSSRRSTRSAARPSCGRPTSPSTSTSRAGWCSAAGWSARACWRSWRDPADSAPASGAPAPACCATSRSPAPRRTCGPSSWSSTPARGGSTRSGTPGCPTARQPPARCPRTPRASGSLLARRPDRSGHRRRPCLRGVRRPGGAVAGVRGVHRRPRGARPRPGRAGAAGRSGLDADRRLALLRLHPRPARRLLRRARPAGRGGAARPRTPRRPGRSRTSAATGSPATWWSSRRSLLRPARRRTAARASPAPTWPAGSTSTTCAAAPGCAMPVQAAEIGLRRQLEETGIDAVRFLGATRADDVTTARFDVAGTTYAVRVRTRAGDEQRLTCQAIAGQPGADPRPARRLGVL